MLAARSGRLRAVRLLRQYCRQIHRAA